MQILKGKKKKYLSMLIVVVMIISMLPGMVLANSDGDLDSIAGEIARIYQYLDESDKAAINDSKSELLKLGDDDAQWKEIVRPLLTEDVKKKFNYDADTAKEAAIAFAKGVWNIYYSTDKGTLTTNLSAFKNDFGADFQKLFGTDVTIDDLYRFLQVTRSELTKFNSDNVGNYVNIFLADNNSERINAMHELVEVAMRDALDNNNDLSTFKGKLSAIDWTIENLIEQQKALAGVIDPGNKTELALGKALVRSETTIAKKSGRVELTETGGGIYTGTFVKGEAATAYELSIMNVPLTNLVAWASSDADIVSVANGELTAKNPGTATVTAYRSVTQKADEWLLKINVTVDPPPTMNLGEITEGSEVNLNLSVPTALDFQVGNISLTLVVPAAATSITVGSVVATDDVLEIQLSVGGLDNNVVTLTLPIPKNIPAGQAGAFHQKGNVWEYRAAQVINGQLVFETNLSKVAIAEAVAIPGNLKAAVSGKDIKLTWAAVGKAGDQVTYDLYRDGNLLQGNIGVTTYTDNVSNYSTTYNYQVRAIVNSYQSALSTVLGVTSGSAPSGGSGGPGGGGSTTDKNSTTKSVTANGATITFGDLELNIPAGAVEGKNEIKVERLTNTAKLHLAADQKFISEVFELTKDVKGKFSKPVKITLSFDKSKVDLDKYHISLYWLNEETGQWIELEDVRVNIALSKVNGNVDHFTKFAVIATKKAEPKVETPEVKLLDIAGHWAENEIKQLVAAGAITGYPDGRFLPNNNITRAEFATVLVKAFGYEASGGKVFKDTASHWAKEYIAIAAAHGLIKGYNDNFFGPNDLITREQMALMMINATKLEAAAESKQFTDQADIAAWALAAVKAAADNELITGYPDGSFGPKKNATRAEAVTIIVRAYN